MMQAAIRKNNLMKQPMVVSLKGGASGAEALMPAAPKCESSEMLASGLLAVALSVVRSA
jgi:hypothetical protein